MSGTNAELIAEARAMVECGFVYYKTTDEREALVTKMLDALEAAGDELDKALTVISSVFIAAPGREAKAKAEALDEASTYVTRECFHSLTRGEVAKMLSAHAAEYHKMSTK